MTKTQITYYVVAVIIITISVYLYTSSYVQSPESDISTKNASNNISPNEEIMTDDNKLVPSTSNSETTLPNDTPGDTAIMLPADSEYNLVNTNWRWLRTENATGTIISKPKSVAPFILKFGASDSMGSQTDCNTIAASFVHTESKLAFGPLMSTKMYCENSQESEYAEQLSFVESYTIVDNMLKLALSNSGAVMFFVKVN